MLRKKWNYILLLNFFMVLIFILFIGGYYKNFKTNEFTLETYNKLSSSMIYKITNLISEKKNSTLSIALSQSKSTLIQNAVKNHVNLEFILEDLSLQLRKETDFKNVWFQVIDKDGISLARSWSDKKGDDLTLFRDDVITMIKHPQINTTISVGLFDLSFKAMIPMFSKSGDFIGIFEAITHFNSIAKKISEEGVSPIVLVSKIYTQQLKYPINKLMVDGHYVANKNADEKYLSLLDANGVLPYISNNKSYLIDEKNQNIVINYTLYSSDNLPMANILLFKSLSSLNSLEISNMKTLVNLFTLLAILITMIIFFFLYNREKNILENEDERSKYILLFGGLAFAFSLIYYQFLAFNYEKNRLEHLKEHNKNVSINYTIIYDKLKTIATTMFELCIDTPEVVQPLLNAYADEELKEKSRQKLYSLLHQKYDFLKTQYLQQLHFHLKDNESFLRFSRPDVYGENLTHVRPSVDWVNKNNQVIDGFEEGKFYNDFRFIFPLTQYDKKTGQRNHIGSVETSFSPYAIIKEFIKDDKTKASFIVNSTLLSEQAIQEETTNYRKSLFKNFYLQKSVCKQLHHSAKCLEYNNISTKNIELADKKILEGEIFSIISEDLMDYYTFIPIKNPTSKKVVAAIILETKTYEINKRYEYAQLQFFLGLIAIILVFLFLYREYTSKRKLELLSNKTRRILDTQDSIVIITNAKRLIDVNKRFLTFFGFSSERTLSTNDYCICQNFIKKEHYYSRSETTSNWVEEIMQLNPNERIVLMKDTHEVQHGFSVSTSKYAQDSFIITFNDITYTIEEQLRLKQKVYLDKLTGAYNREFFHTNIEVLIQSCNAQSKELGLIIFDIDHFKAVNDTYGHNKGDEVLISLSQCVQESIRANDFFIRWGGEEFIVLLCVKSAKEAARVAEILRAKIENLDFKDLERVTCSFGAILINKEQDIVANIERADKALYKAKESGRNRVILA